MNIEEYLQEWSYLAVFVLSALPWVESSAIVVIAIAFGLNPVLSTILAFAGNWMTVLLVVFLFDRWQQWKERKRAARGQDNDPSQDSKKSKRAHSLFVKYGLPGLSIIGPLLIGTEIAAAFGMLFKAPRRKVLIWMTVSLAFWTVLFAVGAHFGLTFIT
ncbi:small multi-drug export protein [Paenibacillus qinlingensis]|uniref:Membrane protein n=1 Tax=Paenibacillus qinlingensis TaxID=1837343 RepID=A0ABU1NWH4_9BACL|nr:small multi-drug export protein [Paenibacillus qinlingensis]MDR6551829.1 putative membrane protein [Paenibacillus qinlingensis]